jgi:aprataxin
MAPKPAALKPNTQRAEIVPPSFRSALSVYIRDPSAYPSVVVSYDSDFVTIHDLYPKSTVHLLVLPRAQQKTQIHPLDALNDIPFLTSVRAECNNAKGLAASELRRRFGKFSEQDQMREAALSADTPPPDTLPVGRDWESSIRVGVHAAPSMSNLHIHVISSDRHSDALRHRKHYNSFSTPFFVPLDDFPLDGHDVRRWPQREGYLKSNLLCWRCGQDFGNRFQALKAHLTKEFEDWKRE